MIHTPKCKTHFLHIEGELWKLIFFSGIICWQVINYCKIKYPICSITCQSSIQISPSLKARLQFKDMSILYLHFIHKLLFMVNFNYTELCKHPCLYLWGVFIQHWLGGKASPWRWVTLFCILGRLIMKW